MRRYVRDLGFPDVSPRAILALVNYKIKSELSRALLLCGSFFKQVGRRLVLCFVWTSYALREKRKAATNDREPMVTVRVRPKRTARFKKNRNIPHFVLALEMQLITETLLAFDFFFIKIFIRTLMLITIYLEFRQKKRSSVKKGKEIYSIDFFSIFFEKNVQRSVFLYIKVKFNINWVERYWSFRTENGSPNRPEVFGVL